MRLAKLVLSVICLAIVTPHVAFADSESRESIEHRKIMFDYAKCVVKKRHDRAAEAVLSAADGSRISNTYSDLIIPDCLVSAAGGGAEMSLSGDLYRYALADALVNADFAKSAESDFSNRLALAHVAMPSRSELDAYLASKKSKHKQEARENFAERAAVAWLSRFGECVVRRDPVKARQWLLTATGVPEEMSRINDLRSVFGTCLADGTVKFSRVTMRGTVALNYYRLAKATIQPAAGKSN